MNQRQQEAAERAKKVLVHYLATIGEKAGIKADPGDLEAEVRGIVDDILEAATPAPRSEHAEAVDQLRKESANDPDVDL